MASPSGVTIYAYNVGFGDCFLLRFNYPPPDRDRHVLIDFGSFPRPDWAPEDFLQRIARDIGEKCGGKLDALVATHRHADHVSGFARASDGDGPGDIIAALEPDLIVQPWTEDPDAAVDATAPTGRFLRALAAMQDAAFHAGRNARALFGARSALADELAFLGDNNIGNRASVENLIRMAARPGARARYVFFGSESGLDELLPGVRVHVLGPPTLEQTQTIRKQRRTDPDEFWHVQAATTQEIVESAPLFPDVEGMPSSDSPPHARWLLRRLRSLNRRELLEIVRSLDSALNNTSVILLFEINGRKLLFPGDAQIENWRYAFDQPGVLDLLADTDFYKVGHHGSLNATPKTLWNRFTKRSKPGAKTRRLHSIVSTEPGHHGSEARGTEVPRTPLMEELESRARLHRTDELEQAVVRYHRLSLG